MESSKKKICTLHNERSSDSYTDKNHIATVSYHIAGKFGGGKVWRIW